MFVPTDSLVLVEVPTVSEDLLDVPTEQVAALDEEIPTIDPDEVLMGTTKDPGEPLIGTTDGPIGLLDNPLGGRLEISPAGLVGRPWGNMDSESNLKDFFRLRVGEQQPFWASRDPITWVDDVHARKVENRTDFCQVWQDPLLFKIFMYDLFCDYLCWDGRGLLFPRIHPWSKVNRFE